MCHSAPVFTEQNGHFITSEKMSSWNNVHQVDEFKLLEKN
jgi:hypothetical protein